MPNDQPLVVACSACSSLPPPAVATIPHRAISTIARHSEFGGYKNRRHNAHTPHTTHSLERASNRPAASTARPQARDPCWKPRRAAVCARTQACATLASRTAISWRSRPRGSQGRIRSDQISWRDPSERTRRRIYLLHERASERASEHQARASIRTVPPSLLNLICVRHNKSQIAAAAAVTRKEAAAALPSSSRGGSSCFLFLNEYHTLALSPIRLETTTAIRFLSITRSRPRNAGRP